MIQSLLNDEFLANFGELEACLRVLRHAENDRIREVTLIDGSD